MQYFRKNPSRIFVLLAIVAVGTPLLLGYEALSTQRKRVVALWTIGALALAATAFAIHCLYLLACLARLPYHVGILWVCVVAALFPCVIAACLWWAFYRITRAALSTGGRAESKFLSLSALVKQAERSSEHPTSNIQWRWRLPFRYWMFDVGCFVLRSSVFRAWNGRADFRAALQGAVRTDFLVALYPALGIMSAMKRIASGQLDVWRTKNGRKPLLLQGARQVGKTYSLQEFGRNSFLRHHYINFEEQERFAAVFGGDLNPDRVVQDLSLLLNTPIDRQADLLIFDEIQQCPRALTSLKYFAERMPELAVCAAGSLLGVHLGESSFPVGKVDELRMGPLTFAEFILAGGNPMLHGAFAAIHELMPLSEALHAKLWEEFKFYLITGGLPEVVTAFNRHRADLFAAFQEARAVQTRLVSDYVADMAKHCGKQNAMHLERLWRHIPAQLGRDQSGSAPKFVFKDVLPGIRGYERLAGAIDWLEAAGLILRVPIANSGQLPFPAYEKENFFKLFVFDVGILGALSRLPVKSVLDYDYGTYKGFYAENFAAQEFRACQRDNLACWREGSAEVEFICELDGAVIPIEVKSGWVTQAKSLKVFADKYRPPFSAVFSGRNLGADPHLRKHYYPLYLASKFPLPGRRPDDAAGNVQRS